MSNPRQCALKALTHLIQKGYSWEKIQFNETSAGDKSFIQALCFGVIRHLEALEWITQKLLKKALKPKDHNIQILLMMGIFECWQMHTPDYAAVSETVSCTPKNKPWAKGLINANLHQFLEHKETLIKKAEHIPCLPEWLILTLKANWPDRLKDIITQSQKPAPMHCRVNRQKISRDQYIHQFELADITIHQDFPDAITFNTPCSVEDIPGFNEGFIAIQDLAPQRTPYLLDLNPGDTVLDACAAPGGKTCHMLEYCPDITLMALDIDENRLMRIQDNISRLQLGTSTVKLLTCDARDSLPDSCFSKILIDAPCSGTGVIRRHPDIKIHRTAKDIEQLNQSQKAILNNLWRHLKTGGTLLYATCSILKAENEKIIESFLQTHSDAALDMSHQYFPTESSVDGFYYGKLVKKD